MAEIRSRRVTESGLVQCPTCKGTGIAYRPICQECGAEFTAEQIQAMFEARRCKAYE
ncbi:MAG: hypothetical protein GX657_16035, partial [Chloroflexi bacterium]|nr:hypothetical protein [Chloroflexota bacterium]